MWEGSPNTLRDYTEARAEYQRQPNILNRARLQTVTHTISKQLNNMKERLVKAERQSMQRSFASSGVMTLARTPQLRLIDTINEELSLLKQHLL